MLEPRDLAAVIRPHSGDSRQHRERCGKENHCVEVGVKPGLSRCGVSEVITQLHVSMQSAVAGVIPRKSLMDFPARTGFLGARLANRR